MYVHRKYKKCAYCEVVGGLFYARMKKRKTGKVTFSLSSKCNLCHREDENLRQMKLFQQNKSKYVARAKAWRDKNRKQYNRSQRLWYKKTNSKYYAASDYGIYS